MNATDLIKLLEAAETAYALAQNLLAAFKTTASLDDQASVDAALTASRARMNASVAQAAADLDAVSGA